MTELKNAKRLVDFHTHSTFSDGTDTPTELVEKAVALGLGALALTDHNSIEGLGEFLNAASHRDIRPVPGVEISTDYGEKELHVLALFVKESSYDQVREFLAVSRRAKEQSNRDLIERLKAAGYDVDYQEIVNFTPNGNINRGVIAQYMHSKGLVGSVREGFLGVLSKKSGFYVPPKHPSTVEAIRFVKSIGAVAVLAHPLFDLTEQELEQLLPMAKEAGLDALEAHYSVFTPEQRQYLCCVAEENGLKISGGSDYHGAIKPHISLATGTGDLEIPWSVYETLAP